MYASVAVDICSHGTPIERSSNFIMRKFNNVFALSFLQNSEMKAQYLQGLFSE